MTATRTSACRPARERGARIETKLTDRHQLTYEVAPRVSAGRGLKLGVSLVGMDGFARRPARERGARIETRNCGDSPIPANVAPRVSAGRGLKLVSTLRCGSRARVAPRVSAGRGLKHVFIREFAIVIRSPRA